MRCPFILSHQGCVHLASLSSVHRNTGHLGLRSSSGFSTSVLSSSKSLDT